jgi:hypothetical protein
MNTGAVLRFEFDDRREVRRSETSIFRQVSPGLVLLLIGDGRDGCQRRPHLVTATYPPEQNSPGMGRLLA